MVLEVNDLRTYFYTRRGVVKAVDGVTFQVQEGETVGIVGESGCGKTVTGLSILRLVPLPAGRIVSGTILLHGDDLLKKTEEEMRHIRGCHISMIMQDPMTSLNPAFSIGDQVAEAIQLHQEVKGKALWKRAISALQMVRIPSPEKRLREYPHQMSGGMRQRVMGAMMLACEPLLLICDEPTTSLDVTTQTQYLQLIKQLQIEKKFSMIFITHDLGIVYRLCDRVLVMYAGKVVEDARAKSLFSRPCHPYTRALMESIPSLLLNERPKRLKTIQGSPPDLLNAPKGCLFADRCTERERKCETQFPARVEIAADHYVWCWKGSR